MSSRAHHFIPLGLRFLLALAISIGGNIVVAQELTVAVARLPVSLSFYVAEAEGYFADEGVRLKILDCDFGRVCLKRLLDGEAEMATVADTPIVLASFSGSPFFVLATISESQNDSKMMTRKNGNVVLPGDLAGKRIGTITGTSAQYFMDTYLLYHGIDRRDVSVSSVPAGRAAAAIANGEVDVLAVFEPFAFAAAKALGSDARVLPSGRINRTTFNLVMDRRLAGARDDDLAKILRALGHAGHFIREQPRKAQAILRNRLKLEQDFIDWIWADYEFDLSLDQSLIAVLESQARWASREGYVKGSASPNFLNILYTKPLAKVRPGAVSIVK